MNLNLRLMFLTLIGFHMQCFRLIFPFVVLNILNELNFKIAKHILENNIKKKQAEK